MARHEVNQRNYKKDGEEEPDLHPPGVQRKRRVVVWHHNESTFYANDCRQIRWVWTGETAKPVPKGEGASLMVADFVSADYGWLRSPDGLQSARVLFKAGKNRNGYFSSPDILKHTTRAMDILNKHYPDDDHIFVFDNAPSHMKRADTALSACGMPLHPTKPLDQTKPRNSEKPDNWLWGVNVPVLSPDGKPTFGSHGKILKKRVPMSDGWWHGAPQSLYFTPDNGSGRPLVFKGMIKILQERGISIAGLKRECPGFKCEHPDTDCCIRRTLWNQPDFSNIQSLLEEHCKTRHFEVVFLPKFHCELNFIEQCWGMAKRVYRLNPRSSSEADLERNTIAALDAVDLKCMRR
jgi:transposase